METFKVSTGFHINTHGGDLDVPNDAEIVINDNGEYAGYITAEGDLVPHRGQDISSVAPAETPSEVPAATPAAQAHAEETGVDLTQVEGSGKDGTITKADVAAVATSEEETHGTPDSGATPETAA